MKVAIISGSHRDPSQSEKVARVVEKTIKANQLFDETWLFSLKNNPLPLWDESIWHGDEAWQQLLDPLSQELKSADALVIVAPEWHGQVPAGLKNFFLLWGKGELAHKPALLVSVSASDGGAYPIAELRMSSYKNNRICYLPEHLIVRNVESILNDDDDQNDERSDRYIKKRMLWCLELLREYASALESVRASGLIRNKDFPHGM